MWLWLLACAEGGDEAPCEALGSPSVEIAPAEIDFGAFEAGAPLYVGHPPQGGALYSPFHARVEGLADLDLGTRILLTGTDPANDTVIAETEYEQRLVCANVGESAGQWLGADLHLRFGDWTVEALAGRPMTLTLAVEGLDGTAVSAVLEGVLAGMEEG